MPVAKRLSAFLATVVVVAALASGAGATEVKLAEIERTHTLRRQLLSSRSVPCDSWRFAVETNTLREWETIPAQCEGYVGNYMMGSHYRSDSRVVVDEAIAYAEGLELSGQQRKGGVGVRRRRDHALQPPLLLQERLRPYNWTKFAEYLAEARSPALPDTLRLYQRLQALGIKPVILTGRHDDSQEATAKNLASAGYTGYEKLVHRPQNAKVNPRVFKSGERRKLEDAGYVIVGNIGDQWSDLLGEPEGARTFKLPSPMYCSA
ncbi:hypothetical protein HU200_020674 [Digitaria exilis]|uniref:Acid phosphatase n=1 Tax=Digitaria exilis TaxID=1010633 RepID=A0A835KCJ5_9POAL|nr:hypothetical protein HU200_020674 [Digitaria exilis]